MKTQPWNRKNKQRATLKNKRNLETLETDRGTNPIPHPKERQRTGEAVSNRHTGNSVAKTLDRGELQGQYDKKGVLNRRFKRLFGDFFGGEKVTPPAGGSSCEQELPSR